MKGVSRDFASSILIFIVCMLLSYSAGIFGSFFNYSSTWYESIKPSIAPPNWMFPVVWNILYFSIGLSLFYLWTNKSKKNKKPIFTAFAVNLIANGFWSYFFFGLQMPGIAFIDLLVILISLVWIMYSSWTISHKVTYLLIPYLIWIVFTGILNLLILI